MRMTPRLLAAATVVFVSVARTIQGLVSLVEQVVLLAHGVSASVFIPAHRHPSPSWSFPCVSLLSTAFMPTV